MGVSVKKNYFQGLRGALEDIARDEFNINFFKLNADIFQVALESLAIAAPLG